MSYVIGLIWLGATLLFMYMVFQKMDITPWKGLVPGYNLYLLCEEFDGNGFRLFLFLIPIYGIILWIKMCIKWAHTFGRSTGFGVGLALAQPVFLGIIALDSKACYQRTVESK